MIIALLAISLNSSVFGYLTKSEPATTEAPIITDGSRNKWRKKMKFAPSTILLAFILLTACSPIATPSPVTTGPVIQTLITPPYDNCVANDNRTPSGTSESSDILDIGFSSTIISSCDAQRGAINYSIVTFGGKKGSIFNPPSQEATASGNIIIKYKSPFTGDLKIEATLAVNSKTGVAAGSATALPDFQDVVQGFLLPEQLDAFLTLAKGFIFGTFAGLKTDANLSVDTDTFQKSVAVTVGGHGFGASFPIPPWSQNGTFNSEPVVISMVVPVVQGQTILITTGISTDARAYGWASAYWNPRRDQESFVTSISLIRPYLPIDLLPVSTSTQTATTTPTPTTPTPTSTVTPTAAITSTPPPTNTPMPASSLRGTVTVVSNCRYGPDWPYIYKYGVPAGTQMEAIGRDLDGNWLKIQAIGGNNPCWIKAAQMQVNGDVMTLPDAYPFTQGLPISPFFPRITLTGVSGSGGTVNVSWQGHDIRKDLNTEQGIEYIVEIWTCVSGKPTFYALGFEPLATDASFQVDNSCGMTSHADVIGEDKEGFSLPAEIAMP